MARYAALFTSSRLWLVAVILLFVAGIVAGVLGATVRPEQHAQFLREATERLRPALDALRAGDSNRAISMILWNNLRIALLVMGTGALVVFLFMPVVSIGANGYLLGALAIISQQGLDRLLLSVVPHGIFEVPALIIAGAWGLKMGLAWLLPSAAGRRAEVWRATVFEAAWIVPLVTVLLIVAAFVEVLVTGPIVRAMTGG
ncbi:MAG: stage II sporulation protein M [Chloroflexi bacterium]|nr:stage II sporulation protein M [Chloroflexota bacterium]